MILITKSSVIRHKEKTAIWQKPAKILSPVPGDEFPRFPGRQGGMSSSPSGGPGRDQRDPGGFVVYIVVIISIAALLMLGIFFRFCLKNSARPPVSGGQASSRTLVSLRKIALVEGAVKPSTGRRRSHCMLRRRPWRW